MAAAAKLSDEELMQTLGPDASGRRDERQAMRRLCPWMSLALGPEELPKRWQTCWAPVLHQVLGAIKSYLADPHRRPVLRDRLLFAVPAGKMSNPRNVKKGQRLI
jgi:hypothetical protein